MKTASFLVLLLLLFATPWLTGYSAYGLTIPGEWLSPDLASDRFDWQTLETEALKVSWYQGDASFGKSALDAANAGLESINKFLTLELAQPIEVYIYANIDDLHSVLGPDSEPWVAGHADPATNRIQVVIEPGSEQGIQMEQRIPHELMHVLLYRHVGAGYSNLPAWFREGMATLAELYPNADYARVLTEADAANHLIPLRELCISFPADTGQAFLAYAESRSFTDFLRSKYGSEGLLTLGAFYADGVDCEQGTERAFNSSLASLESQWQLSLSGSKTFLSTLQNVAPYLALLCLVLIVPFVGILTTLRKKGTRHESATSFRK